MTAPDPRLGEIEARLEKVPAKGESTFIGTMLPIPATTELWNLRQLAREDVAYLLTELRKREDALARVESLAKDWDATHEVFPRSAAGVLAKAHGNQLRAAVTAAMGGGE